MQSTPENYELDDVNDNEIACLKFRILENIKAYIWRRFRFKNFGTRICSGNLFNFSPEKATQSLARERLAQHNQL